MPHGTDQIRRAPKLSKDKLRSMREAVADSVRSGDTLLIEGFTHLICFAAGHEIIRQGIGNLTAARLTPDLVYDQLLEAGLVKKMIFSWAGNPGVGSLHALRRRSQKGAEGAVELEEYSHFGMVARLLAGSAGLPFWPLDNYTGSDIPGANALIKKIECPYTGKELATVPALNPDVTIIHCQRSDREGNAQVWGLLGTQKEAVFAAKRVIVVAEEIVDTSLIRRDPNRTLVPGILVDHVVHEPWGCHPSYVQGHYDRDNDFYVKWEDISRESKTYQDYLAEFVHGVKDRKGYLTKAGSGLIDRLKAKPRRCEGVDYGY
ncbi:CoA transferase subunit A [bacterium]|nr:CoA transferase subunit A [bacterium]